MKTLGFGLILLLTLLTGCQQAVPKEGLQKDFSMVCDKANMVRELQ